MENKAPIANDVHASTQQLVKDFMRPRESKAPVVTDTPQPQPVPKIEPKADDFDEELEELEPEPEEEPVKELLPAKKEETKARGSFLDTIDETDVYIGLYDTGQTAFFTTKMKNRMKKKLENSFDEMRQLCRKISKGLIKETDLTESQLKDFFILQNFLENKEEVPLSDKEYEKMHRMVSKVVEENGGKMPPWLGILFTLFGTTMKRVQLLNSD